MNKLIAAFAAGLLTLGFIQYPGIIVVLVLFSALYLGIQEIIK